MRAMNYMTVETMDYNVFGLFLFCLLLLSLEEYVTFCVFTFFAGVVLCTQKTYKMKVGGFRKLHFELYTVILVILILTFL